MKRQEAGGIPDWWTVDDWLDEETDVAYPEIKKLTTPELKNPMIPTLENYESAPDDYFWEFFPSRELPTHAETKIDIEKLEECIDKVAHKMTAGRDHPFIPILP